MTRTLVSLHAHPDDETLLTGGTLARAAAAGDRVVLVTATAGEVGLTGAALHEGLGTRRRAELDEAARRLGVARVVLLGHADSGQDPAAMSPHALCRQDVDAVAAQVADVVLAEDADLLTGYDAAGGYGHPDHVMVHRVARAVAADTGVRLMEATVDRRSLGRALRWVGWLPGLPEGFTPTAVRGRWSAREDLTHHVDVRDVLATKRAALRAHASQRATDRGSRTAQVLLALPPPLARRVLGTEWFVEPGRAPGRRPDVWD